MGGKIFHIPICSPDILLQDSENYVVLITVNDRFTIKRIKQQLEDMKIPYVYPSTILDFSLNMFWRYDSFKNKKFHELHTYKVVNDNMDKIRRVQEMLSDNKSIELYNTYVERVKYNMKYYMDITDDIYESYFGDGIFKYSAEEVLVDGGALDGDDVIWFSSLLQREGKVLKNSYSFEPDSFSFNKTRKNLDKYYNVSSDLYMDGKAVQSDQFKVFRAGLYDKNSEIEFCQYDNEGSCFIETQESGLSTPVARLDDIVKDEKVTFIKYDLEGAEIPAIKGAEKTIKKNKPKLAISIYHNIEDLWEIALLIKKYVPEYKLFIRHHTTTAMDKTLYAALECDLKEM